MIESYGTNRLYETHEIFGRAVIRSTLDPSYPSSSVGVITPPKRPEKYLFAETDSENSWGIVVDIVSEVSIYGVEERYVFVLESNRRKFDLAVTKASTARRYQYDGRYVFS